MTPAEHDEVCAAVSHLPHLLASVYLETFFAHRKDWFALGGTSFRDWLRVAGASPEIWMDIFWANRGKILSDILRFQEGLQNVASLLAEENQEKFQAFLAQVFQLKEDLRK
ncbi:MAG: prephenate dehydrogenase dimerization domain-containing protein [Candidatus Caldatribacteriaceae bacterium]